MPLRPLDDFQMIQIMARAPASLFSVPVNNRPLRVLHCITSLRADGAQHMLLKVCRGLKGRSFRFLVVSLSSETELAGEFARHGVEIRTLKLKRSPMDLGKLLHLSRLIDEFQPDVVHGWMYHANLAVTFAGSLSRRKPPVLWNIRHGLQTPGKDRLITRAAIRLSAALSRRPAAVVYCSSQVAAEHQSLGFAGENQVIIPNGFNPAGYPHPSWSKSRLQAEYGLPHDALVVGTAGRYHPHKDYGTFLRAAGCVAAVNPRAVFVAAGRGVAQENDTLLRQAALAGIEGRLFLLGPRTDLSALLPAFDVFCSSSLTEGFPNVVAEAMLARVPCVVTDAGFSPGIVGDTGLVVDRGDPRALAKAVIGLLSMPKQARRECGARARERIRSLFPLRAALDAYQSLYRETAGVFVPSSQDQHRLDRAPEVEAV